MANRGLRVLAFAYRDGAELNGTPYTTTDIETSLVYLGLVALSDPVRPGSAGSDSRLPHSGNPRHHGHRRLRADRRQHC